MLPNGREIIRDGYQRGLPVTEIARLADSTRGSVKVIAHRMRLTHRRYVSARIPEPQRDDYYHLRLRKRLSRSDAHAVLGVPL